MVGIAGRVSNTKEDVRLGDVVDGKSSAGWLNVVQWRSIWETTTSRFTQHFQDIAINAEKLIWYSTGRTLVLGMMALCIMEYGIMSFE